MPGSNVCGVEMLSRKETKGHDEDDSLGVVLVFRAMCGVSAEAREKLMRPGSRGIVAWNEAKSNKENIRCRGDIKREYEINKCEIKERCKWQC